MALGECRTPRGCPRRGDRPVTEVGGPGRLDRLLAAKEIVIACGPGGVGKTTTAAALGAAAATPLRPFGVGVDRRSRPSSRRRARPVRYRERRGAGSGRGIPGRQGAPEGEAFGRDARHLQVLGRAGSAITRRATSSPRRSSPTRSTATSRHASLGAPSTSRWSDCSNCTRAVSTTC